MSGEVAAYADFIGLNLKHFPDLVWIAEEGLRCPVPEGWKLVREGKNHFFEHTESRRTQNDHPCDAHYRQLAQREMVHSTLTQLQRKLDGTPLPIVELEVDRKEVTKGDAAMTRDSHKRRFGVWIFVLGFAFVASLLLLWVLQPRSEWHPRSCHPTVVIVSNTSRHGSTEPDVAPHPRQISPSESPVDDEGEGWFW